MSIILKLIEERENKILTFGKKAEEREELVKKLAVLDKEINEFDKQSTLSEIEELTQCAVSLGLIEVPKTEEENSLENALTEA